MLPIPRYTILDAVEEVEYVSGLGEGR